MLAVITGASSGIGEATAKVFASHGYALILTYLRGGVSARNVKADCEEIGALSVEVDRLDLSDNHSISRFADIVMSRGRHPDVLINNAGMIDWTEFGEMTFEQIDHVLNVNLSGTIKLTQMLGPMVQSSIINVASDVGSKIHSGLLPYSVSKAGIIAFTRGLAELHPDLRIHAVSPDKTDTRMNRHQGRSREVPADIIYRAATGAYDYPPGSNIEVSEVVTG